MSEALSKQLASLPDNHSSRILRKVFARAVLNDTEITRSTRTLLTHESGLTLFLNAATEFDTVLPPLKQGLRFSFIVTAAPSGASYTVSTSASANVIVGKQFCASAIAGDTGTTDDTITFVDGQSVVGDRVDVICDGTNWFAYALSAVAPGITFTTAS